jgi:hypothetical protein
MTGIQARHTRSCRSHEAGSCNCRPSYRAWVYDKRSKQKIRKTFSSQAEAKSWRDDAATQVRRKTLRAPSKTTLREAADAWVEDAEAGIVLNRNSEPYKPSVIRSYAQGFAITSSLSSVLGVWTRSRDATFRASRTGCGSQDLTLRR